MAPKKNRLHKEQIFLRYIRIAFFIFFVHIPVLWLSIYCSLNFGYHFKLISFLCKKFPSKWRCYTSMFVWRQAPSFQICGGRVYILKTFPLPFSPIKCGRVAHFFQIKKWGRVTIFSQFRTLRSQILKRPSSGRLRARGEGQKN